MHSESQSMKDLTSMETGKLPATGPLQNVLQCPAAHCREEQALGPLRPVLPSTLQYGKDPQSKGLERWEACKATKSCSDASKILGSKEVVAQIVDAKQENASCSVLVCGKSGS